MSIIFTYQSSINRDSDYFNNCIYKKNIQSKFYIQHNGPNYELPIRNNIVLYNINSSNENRINILFTNPNSVCEFQTETTPTTTPTITPMPYP
jgi:hypothetical protein